MYSMGQFTCKYCGAPPPLMHTSNNTISFKKPILDPKWTFEQYFKWTVQGRSIYCIYILHSTSFPCFFRISKIYASQLLIIISLTIHINKRNIRGKIFLLLYFYFYISCHQIDDFFFCPATLILDLNWTLLSLSKSLENIPLFTMIVQMLAARLYSPKPPSPFSFLHWGSASL